MVLRYTGPKPAQRLFRQMMALGAAFVLLVVAALWGVFLFSLRVQGSPMRQARLAAESLLPFLSAVQDGADDNEGGLELSPEARKHLERIQSIGVRFRYWRIVGKDGRIVYHSGSTHMERTYEVGLPIRRADGAVVGQARFGLSEDEVGAGGAPARAQVVWPVLGVSFLVLAVALLAGVLLSHMVNRYQSLTSQFERLDRLANLGTLAGGLAHEIRNPLNAMRLNLHMLQNSIPGGTGSSVQTRQILEDISEEVARLERLLTEFLTYARPERADVRPVVVNDELDDLVEFLGPQLADRSVEVERRYRDELPQVEVDPRLLRQALLNLVMNAVQAMPEGGVLSLTTATENERVVVEISDTGDGIPDEAAEHVFDVFYSTKAGGSGLGLPIARRIVEDAGGSLDFDSTVGEGTRFVMKLPCADAGTRARGLRGLGQALRRFFGRVTFGKRPTSTAAEAENAAQGTDAQT